jgi:hypothetical protein
VEIPSTSPNGKLSIGFASIAPGSGEMITATESALGWVVAPPATAGAEGEGAGLAGAVGAALGEGAGAGGAVGAGDGGATATGGSGDGDSGPTVGMGAGRNDS